MPTRAQPREPVRPRRRRWAHLSDEALLDVRLCDLGLRIERTALAARLERLYDELAARDIPFRPPVWLSNEWFSPDGTPGIAIPFYLAHPRLMRLEQKQMFEVEGGNRRSCMRLLRHEAGHALDTAYRLHFKRRWREAFGSFSRPYPDFYRPKPNSRRYVLHLDAWYAQAHPAEDWAETFAVWLTPRSSWRRQYADWPVARRKLEAVDAMMSEIAGRAPRVRRRRPVDPLESIRQTLREHYEEKRARYDVEWKGVYDDDLRRIFSERGRQSASRFLRENRKLIRSEVARWTGAHSYTIDQVLEEMIDRCRDLRLRLGIPATQARRQSMLLLTVHTMNCLYSTRHEIPL